MTNKASNDNRDDVSVRRRVIPAKDEGRCRFNCRTNREAFRAGYMAGYRREDHSEEDWNDLILAERRAYREWRKRVSE